MITYQKFCTTNDTNGNPRRGWLIGRIGERAGHTFHAAIAWAEEEYLGNAALEHALEAIKPFSPHGLAHRAVACDLGTVQVAPREFKAIRAAGRGVLS